MNKHTRLLLWTIGTLLLAAAIAWLSADDDDRPPIIVTNGSVNFDNGDVSVPIQPTMWIKDVILSEWKPQDADYHGISGFSVTFQDSYAAVCSDASWKSPGKPADAKTPLTGEEVLVEYTAADNSKVKIRLHRRRSTLLGLLGKLEPKIVEPQSHALTPTAPNRLRYEDTPGTGYISQVSVHGTDCAFGAPPTPGARAAFRVWIQPKKEQ